MEFGPIIIGSLIGAAPGMLLWIVIIVLAIIMLRPSWGRAKSFLVAGAGLKILGHLLGVPAVAIVPWLVDRGYGITSLGSINLIYIIFLNVISMAGIICLIYAFWVKFKEINTEETVSIPEH